MIKYWLLLAAILSLVAIVVFRTFWPETENESWLAVYYQGGNYDSPVYSPTQYDDLDTCASWAEDFYRSQLEDSTIKKDDIWECNNGCKLSENESTEEVPVYYCDSRVSRAQWLQNK